MVLSCDTNFTGTLYCHKVTTDFLLAREHFIPPPSTAKDVRLRRPFSVAPHVHAKRCVSDILIALMWRLKYLRRAFSYAHGELQEKADEVSHPSWLMEVEYNVP